MTRPQLLTLTLATSLAACSDDATAPADPTLTVTIAAPAAAFQKVCYDLRVTNGKAGTGEVVWARGTPGLNGGTADADAVCSDAFGFDGEVTYVGTCDASEGGAEGREGSVTLWVDGLYDEAGAYLDPDGAARWDDPCPEGCAIDFRCASEADAAVRFDPMITQAAGDGFFDIAVAFADLFCTARLACEGGADSGREPLVDPATGQPGPTVFVELACTGDAGDSRDLALAMTPVTIACGESVTELDPSVGPGAAWAGPSADPNPTDAVWQLAAYRARQELACDAGPCDALHWDLAIGLDPRAECTIELGATSSAKDAMTDGQTPAATTYPWIEIRGAVSRAGALSCGVQELDAEGSAVQTRHTSATSPKTFCHRFDGEATTLAPACE